MNEPLEYRDVPDRNDSFKPPHRSECLPYQYEACQDIHLGMSKKQMVAKLKASMRVVTDKHLIETLLRGLTVLKTSAKPLKMKDNRKLNKCIWPKQRRINAKSVFLNCKT